MAAVVTRAEASKKLRLEASTVPGDAAFLEDPEEPVYFSAPNLQEAMQLPQTTQRL